MKQNYLDKPDYCLRKAMGVYCIPQYLQSTGSTQRKLAEFLGVSQATISKWLNTDGVVDCCITSEKDSRYAPQLIHILRISAILQRPLHVMLQDVIAIEKNQGQFLKEPMLEEAEMLAKMMESVPLGGIEKLYSATRKGEDHFAIINKLQKSRYVGFFISAGSSKRIEHLIVDTAMALDSALVPASLRIVGKAENHYRCCVASPPNQKHLYIDMEQQGGKYDRGTMAFCVDDDMQGPFMCGSGYVISTDRKSGENRIQWIVILRIGSYNDALTSGFEPYDESLDSMAKWQPYAAADWLNRADREFVSRGAMRQADSIVEPVLRESLPVPTGHYISFSCLGDRQRKFYEEIYQHELRSLNLIDDWNDTHRHVQ